MTALAPPENKTALFASSRAMWCQFAAVMFLAVFGRVLMWNQRPPDMAIYLEPWVAHIVHYGPIQAFAHPFSNYAPAYLYLLALGSFTHDLLSTLVMVKILSLLGTLFLTASVANLLKAVGADWRGALLVLILPSIAINDAKLAQCDALWAGSCVMALAAMIRGRTLSAMLWWGVAIAFKAQGVFIAPVMLGAMIGRRAPLWHWAVPGVVYLATILPPFLLGWPLSDLLTVYLQQAQTNQLAGRLPNPWMLFTVFGEQRAAAFFPIGYAAAGAAAMTIGALAARNARDPRILILLGALAGTALPFLLPKMLERYYFLGDVMTLALAISMRNFLSGLAVRAVQLASVLGHLTYIYFYDDPWLALVGAIFAAAGLGALCALAAPSFMVMAKATAWRLKLRRREDLAG